MNGWVKRLFGPVNRDVRLGLMVAGRASSRASPLPHGFCGDSNICGRPGSTCGVSLLAMVVGQAT